MPKMSSRKPARVRCKHVPHNPDTLQTVCVACGNEIEPTDRGSADRWRKI